MERKRRISVFQVEGIHHNTVKAFIRKWRRQPWGGYGYRVDEHPEVKGLFVTGVDAYSGATRQGSVRVVGSQIWSDGLDRKIRSELSGKYNFRVALVIMPESIFLSSNSDAKKIKFSDEEYSDFHIPREPRVINA